MGASKELFMRMSEEDYLGIPRNIRERHLADKIYSQSVADFSELMQDETYARLYKQKKAISKELDERQYQLRENKRNNKL